MSRARQRIPYLIWGDLQQYGGPIVRDVQAGWRAIECMYAWVYSSEMLALRRFRQLMDAEASRSPNTSIFAKIDGEIWNRFDRSEIDPNFQINKSCFDHLVYVQAILGACHEKTCTIVELGSTFFSAIDKYEIISAEAKRLIPGWHEPEIRWTGIEISKYANEMAEVFHANAKKQALGHYSAFKKDDFSVLYSRFVCSYAFLTTESFVEYIVKNFDGFVVEDAFAASGGELEVYNHGQRETFFDPEYLISQLQRHGFEVYVLGSYPDNPAGTARCHILKLLGVRAGIDIGAIQQTVSALGYAFDPETQRANAPDLLAALNAGVPEERWRQVTAAKRHCPIWGPTSVPERKNIRSHIFDWLYRRKMDIAFYRSGWRLGRVSTRQLRAKAQEAVGDARNRLH